MPLSPELPPIARDQEAALLGQALAEAAAGRGGLWLVAGEAGLGKTALIRHTLTQTALPILSTTVMEGMTTPYGPWAAVLRAGRRRAPEAWVGCGPLAAHLAVLLPELGPAPAGGDSATLLEALRCALASLAPAVIVLDDLHWADNATLEAVPVLTEGWEHSALLLIGAYRSDALPRGHALQRLRTALRRQGRLREIHLAALEAADTAALAARLLGQAASPALAARLHTQTEGVPFFVEAVAAALRANRGLRSGPAGLDLDAEGLPLPESVREAVLVRVEALPPPAQQALEICAVIGPQVELALAAELAGSDAGLEAALAAGLLIESEPGQAAFRHSLIREAVYSSLSWTQRRRLHRQVAEQLETRGGQPATWSLAEHWLAAHDLQRGRLALLALAERWAGVHAYRDAAAALRRALELWAPETEEAQRLEALDRLGAAAQMYGDAAEAARAWRELAEGRREAGDQPRLADTQRRLASLYEMQRQWRPALAARQAAAAAYAELGLSGEAAAERLTAAAHLRSAGQFRAALELLAAAGAEARRAERQDLRARILGLEGNVRARMGEAEAGLAAARAGLALALEHNLAGAAAEVYQRLADSLEHAGDYAGAQATYTAAFDFCQANAAAAAGQICRACLAVVLRQSGEWEQAVRLSQEVLAAPSSPPHAVAVAHTVLGLVAALRGGKWAGAARPQLLKGLAVSRAIELAACELLALWGLAIVEAERGDDEAVLAQLRALLTRWGQIEDRHYAMAPLRWAATRLAELKARPEMHVCADALAAIAAATGQPEALSALAHALGEAAWLEGRPALAAGQFAQAVEILSGLELPFDLACSRLRAGAALAAAGERGPAVEQLIQAYHTARKLGARPLARQAAQALADLGEPVERRVGRRAAGQLAHAGLSPREVEVLGQLRLGHTNREIARALFLSPRTVDMHVRNLLAKLDARSRTDAVAKALALGLLR